MAMRLAVAMMACGLLLVSHGHGQAATENGRNGPGDVLVRLSQMVRQAQSDADRCPALTCRAGGETWCCPANQTCGTQPGTCERAGGGY